MDRVGSLYIPVATPTLGTDPHTRTPSPGDPLLAVLGSFLATALQADCGAAWAAFEKNFPDLPTTVPGAPGAPPAIGTSVVRFVDFADPRKGKPFDANDFPGLFLFRAGRLATYEVFCASTDRRMLPVVVHWVPMITPREIRGEADTMMNAVSACIDHAIYNCRHPAWVVPADRAQPLALLAGLATSTSAVMLTGASFTGPSGATMLKVARPIRITTAPAVGAYETTKNILVTGQLHGGRLFTETVHLTHADGGETLDTIFSFEGPATITFPPMLNTAGAINIGYAASPEAARGSMVQRAGRARIHLMKPGELLPIVITPQDASPPVKGYQVVEAVIGVYEHVANDPAVHSYPLGGADETTILPNGNLFATDKL